MGQYNDFYPGFRRQKLRFVHAVGRRDENGNRFRGLHHLDKLFDMRRGRRYAGLRLDVADGLDAEFRGQVLEDGILVRPIEIVQGGDAIDPAGGELSRTRTMRSESGYGNGRSKLNIAVFAPTASATAAIATTEKRGLLRIRRMA